MAKPKNDRVRRPRPQKFVAAKISPEGWRWLTALYDWSERVAQIAQLRIAGPGEPLLNRKLQIQTSAKRLVISPAHLRCSTTTWRKTTTAAGT